MIDKIWTFEEFIDLDLAKLDGCYDFGNGHKEWYKEGKRHRLNGPAIDFTDGDKFWYKEGKQHRLDGPALEFADGDKYWCIEGEEYTEEEFKIKSFAILNRLEKFL